MKRRAFIGRAIAILAAPLALGGRLLKEKKEPEKVSDPEEKTERQEHLEGEDLLVRQFDLEYKIAIDSRKKIMAKLDHEFIFGTFGKHDA